jgi:hypothetical protein
VGLAFVKLSARDPAHRLGTLVIAPGGPGDSGVAFLKHWAAELAPLRQRYDLIGLDPRGVGESAPLHCMTGAERDAFYAQEVSETTGRQYGSAPESNVETLAEAARKASPIFGEWFVYRTSICETWPVPPTWLPHDINAPGAPEVLLLNNSADPVTTLADAQAVDSALDQAVLVINDGPNHGVYLDGYPCADAIVNAYFLDGTLPADGTTCP